MQKRTNSKQASSRYLHLSLTTVGEMNVLSADIVFIIGVDRRCKLRQWNDAAAGTQADPEDIDVLVWHTPLVVCHEFQMR